MLYSLTDLFCGRYWNYYSTMKTWLVRVGKLRLLSQTGVAVEAVRYVAAVAVAVIAATADGDGGAVGADDGAAVDGHQGHRYRRYCVASATDAADAVATAAGYGDDGDVVDDVDCGGVDYLTHYLCHHQSFADRHGVMNRPLLHWC